MYRDHAWNKDVFFWHPDVGWDCSNIHAQQVVWLLIFLFGRRLPTIGLDNIVYVFLPLSVGCLWSVVIFSLISFTRYKPGIYGSSLWLDNSTMQSHICLLYQTNWADNLVFLSPGRLVHLKLHIARTAIISQINISITICWSSPAHSASGANHYPLINRCSQWELLVTPIIIH